MHIWDFPGGPVVETLPSNAGGAGSIPGRGAKIPHASGPKNQNIKQEQYCNKLSKDFLKNGPHQGFPGGAVVKNPPANAGDTGLSPGPGRSHMPWSNYTRAPQLPSLCSTAREPQLLKPTCLEPMLRNKRSHRNEKPAHSNEE